MADDEKPISIGVRLAPDLAEWLKQQAEDGHRSLSGQVAWALAQVRKQQQPQPQEAPQ